MLSRGATAHLASVGLVGGSRLIVEQGASLRWSRGGGSVTNHISEHSALVVEGTARFDRNTRILFEKEGMLDNRKSGLLRFAEGCLLGPKTLVKSKDWTGGGKIIDDGRLHIERGLLNINIPYHGYLHVTTSEEAVLRLNGYAEGYLFVRGLTKYARRVTEKELLGPRAADADLPPVPAKPK